MRRRLTPRGRFDAAPGAATVVQDRRQIVGLIIHAMQGGRRDFASVAVMRPQRYEVLVDADVADEALRLLDKEI